jgi:hypothetical protein
MQIDHYGFGHIDIEGRSYDADVIIFPDHVQERWRRREGHRLALDDLGSVIADSRSAPSVACPAISSSNARTSASICR